MIAATDKLRPTGPVDAAFALTVDLPMPPLLKAKAYNAWLNDARWHVLTAWRNAGKPVAPVNVPMGLFMRVGFTDRGRNITDCIKAVEDVLVKELPIPDNRWNDRVIIERNADFEGFARVTIAVLRPEVVA